MEKETTMTLDEILNRAIWINIDRKEQECIVLINNKKQHNPFKGLLHIEEWDIIKGTDGIEYFRDLYIVEDIKLLKQSFSSCLFIQYFNPSTEQIEIVGNSDMNKITKMH